MLGIRVHFGAVGIGEAQHIASELDHGALHAQTDAQERDLLFPGIFDGRDLAFDAAVAETGSDQDATEAAQLLCRRSSR